MHKIAVILFPGLNTEQETFREIAAAGMKPFYVRWNENPSVLEKCDGMVIGGGFSYEDRGRAGIIASLDPMMDAVRKQAHAGKPLLGICNGAQIVVESGLVPGVEGDKLAVSLARNKRIQNGKVLGTGYYNAWGHIKCTTDPTSCFFTYNMKEGEILYAPIAHGEGRFTTDIPDLMMQLRDRGQMPFRYCTTQGVIIDEFPTNPNGAAFNAAALCNPQGNVMAIMPHPERAEEASKKLFGSLKSALDAGGVKSKRAKLIVKIPTEKIENYEAAKNAIQFLVSLKITDNEKETFEMAIKRMGIEDVKLMRETHIELAFKGAVPELPKTVKTLIQSGLFLNTNKESAKIVQGKKQFTYGGSKGTLTPLTLEKDAGFVRRLLVRERPDFLGISKRDTAVKQLKLDKLSDVHFGTLWTIVLPGKNQKNADLTFKKLLESHLFANPHRHETFAY
ncbi:phosphoribosylformylglycinamidine synthase I [Candidatus Gracilibacteria bacterium]|nr:phosphoribosylformylglycinamidine synthase I [Candidatus Gracilibacteria bacterium]